MAGIGANCRLCHPHRARCMLLNNDADGEPGMNDRPGLSGAEAAQAPRVRKFREIVLYPLQLARLLGQGGAVVNWDKLVAPESGWREVADDLAGEPTARREQLYTEFVSFMPD